MYRHLPLAANTRAYTRVRELRLVSDFTAGLPVEPVLHSRTKTANSIFFGSTRQYFGDFFIFNIRALFSARTLPYSNLHTAHRSPTINFFLYAIWEASLSLLLTMLLMMSSPAQVS